MRRLNFFPLLLIAGYNLEAATDAGTNAVQSYNAHGIVRQIATDRHLATIQHEAIAGYMSAMTMDFNVKDTNELTGISPADEITFKLEAGENDSWIQNIRLVSHHIEDVTDNTIVIHASTPEL